MKILISSVEGNRQKLDGGAMFGNAPRPLWEKWHKPDEVGRIELACRALLVEVDGTKILCETGIGAFFEPKLAERYGVQTPDTHVLLRSLQALGLAEEDIDFVILSHLHFDHAGGLLRRYSERQSGNDTLVFPKATYIVGENAWKRCQNPHPRDRASFIPELAKMLQDSHRLVTVPESVSSLPKLLPKCISFFYSNGHTPGHMHTRVHGGKETVVFCGDLIPGISWLHAPITMGYDRYPELLIDEKMTLYKEVVSKKELLFFTHDPGYAASHCIMDPNHKVSAKDPIKELVRSDIS